MTKPLELKIQTLAYISDDFTNSFQAYIFKFIREKTDADLLNIKKGKNSKR